MAIIPSLPVTLQNGTTADATQVMANFNAIVSAVNANAANAGINTNITQISGLTVALAPNQGGTGQFVLTPNSVLIGEGTAAVNTASPGAAGNALTSNGPGVDPSFKIPQAYQVGDLYFTTIATNPATRLGYGTWTAYGAGQVPIGVGSFTDGDGNSKTITAGQQLGEYLHTLTTTEMPSHNHGITDPGHAHGLPAQSSGSDGGPVTAASNNPNQTNVSNTATTGITINNTGGGAAHNNVQPSIGVYIWLRTA